jgi:hypothetical protein
MRLNGLSSINCNRASQIQLRESSDFIAPSFFAMLQKPFFEMLQKPIVCFFGFPMD